MKDYNFFESYQKKRSFNVNVKSPVFLGVVAILMILLLSGWLVVQNIIIAAELASASDELTTLQSSQEYQEALKLQNSITAMAEYDSNAGAALERIKEGKILNTGFLRNLSAAMPSNTSIQSLNFTRTSATLNVYVPNQKAAAELVGNLDKSGLFMQTVLTSVISNADAGNYVASINCVLKAGEQK